MYSTAKGAGRVLDRASWAELLRSRTEEEENASGKGLLDGDGCGLLLGLIVEWSVCACWYCASSLFVYLDLGLAGLLRCCCEVSMERIGS
jgi:hypothetical protein